MPVRGQPPLGGSGGAVPQGKRGAPPGWKPGKGGAPSGHHGGGFLHGALHVAENLATGAAHTFTGIPGAIKTAAVSEYQDVTQHPLLFANPYTAATHIAFDVGGRSQLGHNIVQPIAKSYATKYGPVLHHPFEGKSYDAIRQDPFGTLLDAATILSAGAGAIGKTAGVSKTLSAVEVRGPEELAKAGRLDKELAGVKVITDPEAPRQIVEGATFRGTGFRKRAIHAALNKLPAATPILGEFPRFDRELNRLPIRIAEAFKLKAAPLAGAVKRLSGEERTAVGVLARWPLPRLLDAQVAAWRDLRAAGHDVPALDLATDPKVRALYDAPTPRMLKALGEADRLGGWEVDSLAKHGRLSRETADEHLYMHLRVASGAKFDEATGAWTGGEPVDQLKAELEAAGRPQPVYMHDTDIVPRAGVTFAATGGGKAPVPKAPVVQNRAVLQSLGQILLDPSTLLTHHFRVVKYGLYRDLHATLETAGLHVPKGSKLPAGWEYLRRAVGPTQRTAERIPHTEQAAGDFHRTIRELIPNPDEQGARGLEFTTASPDEAATTAAGDRIIVRSSTVRRVTGEFTRSDRTLRWLFDRPTAVWRALVLNYRPAWLVNNIVGNTFMYLLRTGGPAAIREWGRAVHERGGVAALDKLAEEMRVTSHLTPTDIAELFPFQVTQTFKGANSPVAGGAFRQHLAGGLSPLDRGYEQALRRAAVRTAVRKSPEVKARLRAMPKETRSFRQAAKQELKSNPRLVRHVEEQVNAALGDFSNLSPFERNTIRRAVPFYGWFKAITAVTLKLVAERPGRIDLLKKLGDLNTDDQGLPHFLAGAVGVGPNRILKTAGINPYSTPQQVGAGLISPFGYQPGAQGLLGNINPIVGVPMGWLGEAAADPSRTPTLGALLQQWGEGLPQIRLGKSLTSGPPPSKLYEPSRLDELLQFLGAPLRTVNPSRAQQLRQQGR